MKSVSTSLALTAAFVASSFTSFSQCTPVGSITTVSSFTFDNSAQGFTGDFVFKNGPDNLASTPAGTGPRVLTSPTFFAPNNLTNVQFGFDLAGLAPGSESISAYSFSVRYFSGGTFQTATLCSGTNLVNGTYKYSFAAPPQIIGKNFQIVLSFTLAGGANTTITIDNFITNVGASNVALPITLGGFSAVQNANNVSLSWNNVTEANIASYSIERSGDGSSFTKLAALQPTRNDGSGTGYQFTDASPLAGNNLYRVKVEELSGKVSYSAIVRINLGGNSSLQVYPNPVKGGQFGLQISNLAKGDYTIRIYNEAGQVVNSKLLYHRGGSISQTLSLPNLQHGLYTVEVSGATKMQKQIVVE